MIMAEKNNVQDYLEKGLYGTPQIKPEERKKYLGTLRERIYLSMTVAEMRQTTYLPDLTSELKQQPTAKLLLNGSIDSALLSKYIKCAQNVNHDFTLITNDVSDEPEAIGLILTADTAVNEPVIAICDKYPQPEKTVAPEKKSFLKKFFG